MSTARPLPSGLGPGCVGLRVVVRRLLPGQTGPSGGPAMTDLLGVMEEWGDTTTSVRAEDGSLVVIERSLIVSGKPVPPRPSMRGRIAAEDAARRALGSWPAVEAVPLGQWVLRASSRFSARANSVLIAGDPGLPWPEALASVRAFYDERHLPAWAQVIVGSAEEQALDDAGWVSARPGEAESQFHLAGVAHALRGTRAVLRDRPAPPAPLVLTDRLTESWLATDERAAAHPEAATAVLEGPDHVAFATLSGADGAVVARGRAALPKGGDWVGITDVWVSPEQRRGGLAAVVMSELLDWAGSLGGSTAYLQVRSDNPAGLVLYARLNFTAHHAYRYLTPAG